MADTTTQTDRSWLAESMRLTAFFRPGEPVTQDVLRDWWRAAVGSEPESTTSEQHGLKNRFNGPYMGGRLELSATPSRLDWSVSVPVEMPTEGPFEVPVLGLFDETKSQFLAFCQKWLAESPVLKRIALGMVLTEHAAGKPEAMQMLQERIARPCLELSAVSELTYRVNRKRSYSLDSSTEIEINRLQTWSVVTYAGLIGTIALPPGGLQAVEVPGSITAQLQLDVNTVPGSSVELPTESLVPLVRHLAELGTEIAAKGDIE